MSERSESPRQAIREALTHGPVSLRELSGAVSLSEKEIAEHLPHIEKSAKRAGQKYCVEPSKCAKCGFSFEGRSRAKTPSRCPKCKNERIRAARFWLEDG